MKQNDKRLIAAFIIFFVTLLVASIVWKSSDSYYIESYRPTVEKSRTLHNKVDRYKKAHDLDSNEPRPVGMREGDVEKVEGYRSRGY